VEDSIPAAGQGALGIEIVSGNADVAAMLAALQAAEAELRWLLESVGLEVERLDWRVANPPVPDAGVSWLVDERA